MVIAEDYKFAREMALWKKRVRKEWPLIEVLEYTKPDYSKTDIVLGEKYVSRVVLSIGDLDPDDIGVEMLIAENGTDNIRNISARYEFSLESFDKGVAEYKCEIMVDSAGAFNMAGRIYPKNEGLPHRQDFDLVRWL
jgi:phosphorylase/glycogen(starch) synthase